MTPVNISQIRPDSLDRINRQNYILSLLEKTEMTSNQLERVLNSPYNKGPMGCLRKPLTLNTIHRDLATLSKGGKITGEGRLMENRRTSIRYWRKAV